MDAASDPAVRHTLLAGRLPAACPALARSPARARRMGQGLVNWGGGRGRYSLRVFFSVAALAGASFVQLASIARSRAQDPGFCRRPYAAHSILARTLGALSSISRRRRLLCLLGCALSQNDLIPGFLRALAPGPRLRALTRPGLTDGLYLPGLLRDRGFISLRPFLGAALDSFHPGWTFELPPRNWSA